MPKTTVGCENNWGYSCDGKFYICEIKIGMWKKY